MTLHSLVCTFVFRVKQFGVVERSGPISIYIYEEIVPKFLT
jgi:hypothetical protein